MAPGDLLRFMMILAGVLLLFITVTSLAKRRMTEPFCLTWGLISLMMILAGILLRPTEWNRYISGTGILLVMLIAFCVIFGAYFLSTRVSELMRKNLELAMQVSLLNQEKEEMKKRLDGLADRMAGQDVLEKRPDISEKRSDVQAGRMSEEDALRTQPDKSAEDALRTQPDESADRMPEEDALMKQTDGMAERDAAV